MAPCNLGPVRPGGCFWPTWALGIVFLAHPPVYGRVADPPATQAPAKAADTVIVHPLGDGGGDVDWTNRVLRARGCSAGSIATFVPPDVLPYAQRRAESLAQDNLLRLLRTLVLGLGPKGTTAGPTRVADVLASQARLEPLAHASVKHMQVVSTRYAADGTVSLEVMLPLDGEHPGLGALWAALRPPAPRTDAAVVPPESAQSTRLTTGFVINARGTGFEPCLWPRIIDAQGAVLYDASAVPPDILVMRGLMGAARSLEAAQRDERVAPVPEVIHAQRAAGTDPYTLVLGDHDARTFRKQANLAQEARVVVVVD